MSKNHVRLHRRRWEAVRKAVFERDGWRCVMCGAAGRLECDHVTSLEREPGQNPYDPNRLQSICRSCHVAKTARENRRERLTPDQLRWQAYLGELAHGLR